MDMRLLSTRMGIWTAFLLSMLLWVLVGCSSTAPGLGGNSGAVGADAGPWPTAPAHNTANGTTGSATRSASDEAPNATLMVVLRGKAGGDKEMHLDIDKIEVKFQDSWVPVAVPADISKLETATPVKLGSKSSAMLLADTQIPRRKYSHIRLHFADAKTSLTQGITPTTPQGTSTMPLTVQSSTLELGDWEMDAKNPNIINVTVDGTKVTCTNNSATLPTDAITLAKGTATGGISGVVSPPLPTAKVQVYWGDTKVLLGTAVPSSIDGTFTVPNLPAGSYRVKVEASGYHLIEQVKEPVAVEAKVVALTKQLALAADQAAQQ